MDAARWPARLVLLPALYLLAGCARVATAPSVRYDILVVSQSGYNLGTWVIGAEEVPHIMPCLKWMPWLLTAASLTLAGMVAAQADNSPSRIYVVDFMKVEPGDEDRYVEVETTWWKPVHAERIRQGSMHSWSLYRVRYPDGTERQYDFVTVNVFDTFADSELDPFAFLAEVHADADTASIEEETLASRRMVRGEIWYRIDHLE